MRAKKSNIGSPNECELACTDKSYSEHVLCTYLTPSPTNWALYLSRAIQIRLWTILSFIIQSYKIQTLTFFSADFWSQLSFIVCIAFITKKIYTSFFIIWFYNFQYSQDVHFMITIFSLVQENYQNFVFEPLKTLNNDFYMWGLKILKVCLKHYIHTI